MTLTKVIFLINEEILNSGVAPAVKLDAYDTMNKEQLPKLFGTNFNSKHFVNMKPRIALVSSTALTAFPGAPKKCYVIFFWSKCRQRILDICLTLWVRHYPCRSTLNSSGLSL